MGFSEDDSTRAVTSIRNLAPWWSWAIMQGRRLGSSGREHTWCFCARASAWLRLSGDSQVWWRAPLQVLTASRPRWRDSYTIATGPSRVNPTQREDCHGKQWEVQLSTRTEEKSSCETEAAGLDSRLRSGPSESGGNRRWQRRTLRSHTTQSGCGTSTAI